MPSAPKTVLPGLHFLSLFDVHSKDMPGVPKSLNEIQTHVYFNLKAITG
jgi:hypothetical protein